ncbi:MAG: helix-turn-helix transcriptional regulator [Lawsonibacter sp.]
MAKSSNQKTKLLHLHQILLRQTDEEHPITVAQLIEELARYDIKAERKSIYDDLESLRQFGLDIQCRKGRSSGWFVGGRDFQLPELKLLMDAVQSSRFITQKKSDTLIRKLEALASVHQARQLQRQVYVSGRIKVMNESIYYNVDKLHAALAEQKAVTFQYFDYDITRKKVFRRNGSRYTVSPYGLIWNSENYYLVAFDHANRDLRHYRVDKMAALSITDLDREGRDQYPDFQLAQYGQKHFGMYSGPELKVTLRGRRDAAGVVWDRFGQDVILVPDGEEHFTVTLPVVMSPQFFGWLFGLDGELVLISPKTAVDAYRQKLCSAAQSIPNP